MNRHENAMMATFSDMWTAAATVVLHQQEKRTGLPLKRLKTTTMNM